jgi:tetratricopeptide (TPR) repeat protein
VSRLAFLADGRTLAASSGYGQVHLWDVETGTALRRLQVTGSEMALLADGKVLAVAAPKEVTFLDASNFQPRLALHLDEMPISSMALARNGTLLAVGVGPPRIDAVVQYGPEDRPPIRLWRAATARQVATAERWEADAQKRRQQALADAALAIQNAAKATMAAREKAFRDSARQRNESVQLLKQGLRLRSLGQHEQALSACRDCAAQFGRLADAYPAWNQYRAQRVDCLFGAAILAQRTDRLADAEELFALGCDLAQSLTDDFPEVAGYHGLAAIGHIEFARMLINQKRGDEARPFLETAIAQERAGWPRGSPLAPQPTVRTVRDNLRNDYLNLADLLLQSGKHQQAAYVSSRTPEVANPGDRVALHQVLVRLSRCADRAAADEKVPAAERTRLAESYAGDAADLVLVALRAEALGPKPGTDAVASLFKNSRTLLATLQKRYPRSVRCGLALSESELLVGQALERAKRVGEARDGYRRAAEILRPLVTADSGPACRSCLARTLHAEALLAARDDPAKGLSMLEEAFRQQAAACKAEPANARYQQWLCIHGQEVVRVHLKRGAHGPAAAVARELALTLPDNWKAHRLAAQAFGGCIVAAEKDSALPAERRRAAAEGYAAAALASTDRALALLKVKAAGPLYLTPEQMGSGPGGPGKGKSPIDEIVEAQRDLGRRTLALAGWYQRWQRTDLAAATCQRAVDLFERLLIEQPQVQELPQEAAAAHNGMAGLLATAAQPQARDAKRALTSAQRAVQLAPKDAACWQTLGVARYRAGEWKESVAALNKSLQLGSGTPAADWYFLAMSAWKLGQKGEARRWYDKATDWADKHAPVPEELRRFRTEAAALLGIAEVPREKPGSSPPKS